MIVSGKEIIKNMGETIIIEPFSLAQINPNSYNLRLHNELLVYTDATLDMKRPLATRRITIPETGFRLEPGILYLARTVERTQTDSYVPMIEGRSSIARVGLFVHITAGLGNIGSNGYWTLELTVVQPVIIYPWIEICQIYFHQITGEFDIYTAKYKNSEDIQPSYIFRELAKQ